MPQIIFQESLAIIKSSKIFMNQSMEVLEGLELEWKQKYNLRIDEIFLS